MTAIAVTSGETLAPAVSSGLTAPDHVEPDAFEVTTDEAIAILTDYREQVAKDWGAQTPASATRQTFGFKVAALDKAIAALAERGS